MGVGMLQSTLPLYLSEISPTQLRGLFINAYSLYVQLFPAKKGVRPNQVAFALKYWFHIKEKTDCSQLVCHRTTVCFRGPPASQRH